MKNYKLSDETKTLPCGTVLHRVVATTTFKVAYGLVVNAGDVGGWIEKESNLSDNAWVSDNAEVYGNAQVSGNAWVFDNAQVCGTAQVSGDAQASCNAQVYGDAQVYGGDTKVYGIDRVSGDTKVYGIDQVSGDDANG